MKTNTSQNNIFGTDTIFTLDREELALAHSKNTRENQLAFAVMLKFFQTEGRYPNNKDIIHPSMISSLVIQLKCEEIDFGKYDWTNRNTKRFRQEIRRLLGYKKASLADSGLLINWLVDQVLPQAPTPAQITQQAYDFFTTHRLEPFKPAKLDRYIGTACHRFEQKFFADIFQQLPAASKTSIDALLDSPDMASSLDFDDDNLIRAEQIKLHHLKKDIAGAKLKNVAFEIEKLNCLRAIKLPQSIGELARKLRKKYYMRILAELPSGIKAHNPQTRYSSMAVFCHMRSELITDNLLETLSQLIHKLRTSAEMSISKNILSEVKCVNGKFDILYTLASTILECPKGVIDQTIYPKVSEEILINITAELNSNKANWYKSQVQKKMRSLYNHAHRRILLMLLESFTFRTNNRDYQGLLAAIEFIKNNKDVSDKYYPDAQAVPATDLLASHWQHMVIEPSANISAAPIVVDSSLAKENQEVEKQCNGVPEVTTVLEDSPSVEDSTISPATSSIKINRINYEIAVLEEIEKLLSCKVIWVEGTYRYRDPEEDLPKDFTVRPEYYYHKLKLPSNVDEFIKNLQTSLDSHLHQFDDSILSNKKVKIMPTKKQAVGNIKVTPYTAQATPTNLSALQQIINIRWPAVNLIDILKEADLRIGFTQHFNTVASRENLDEYHLIKRLLLCLYAIGSNTGLKRISAANHDSSHSDLRYIKRRYINVANMRLAIAEVVDAILAIRDPHIWGLATTGCACDSTKVSVWDQNLMTEWHTRYQGRGVMIYWHVDKNAACIYSQLKTCSSSEVGSMIKGVLDHCTKMEMNQAYVDTHGQSTIGFAFSYLLHFDLLPRLKNIKRQKLYYSKPSDKAKYKNLALILKSYIDWELIRKHYSEVVKYVAALRIGAVEPDVILKMLSKDNAAHPVYMALTEIGNAVKTIFLCRYLMSEELRIEIHEALNIVENVNSIMGFIFYGKLGEVSTNNRDDQELAVLCLHLLQVCMVYINTLIIQEVLSDPGWHKRLTVEDKRGLTPLIHAHINPYGLFPLDLTKRLIIERPKQAEAA